MTSSARIDHFRPWVFWTGVFDMVGYTALTGPFTLERFLAISNRLNRFLGWEGMPLALPANRANWMMVNLCGFMIVLLGALLIAASLDIQNCAWVVFWEGLVRVFAFAAILSLVVFQSAPRSLLLFGTIDLIIAVITYYDIFTLKELKIV